MSEKSSIFIVCVFVVSGCATNLHHADVAKPNLERSITSLDQDSLPIVQYRTPFTSSYVFTPNDGKRHPAIVLLHGSEGGSQRNMWVHALLLAQSGFAVMNLCWWDCGRDVRSEPMPMMTDIELTNIVKAIKWFQNSQYVDEKLAVYGISKGAELAMILASYQEKLPFKIRAIAIHSPSDVVEPGSNINWLDKRCWVCPEGIQACSYQRQYWNRSCGTIGGNYKPEDFDTLPMWRWNGEALKLGSHIEIERFSGPVLITAGDKDTDWKSDKGRVKRIIAAMEESGRNPEVHIFPGEEHSFGLEAEQKRKALVNTFFRRCLN